MTTRFICFRLPELNKDNKTITIYLEGLEADIASEVFDGCMHGFHMVVQIALRFVA